MTPTTPATAADFTIRRNHRGFRLADFTEYNGHECSIQESSSANEPLLWLGIDDPRPMILAREAHAHGIETDAVSGWVEVPLPPGASISGRMHVTQDMAASLIPLLQHFVDTGELPDED